MTTTLATEGKLPKTVVSAVEDAKKHSKRESIEIAQCQEGINEHEIAATAIRSVKVIGIRFALRHRPPVHRIRRLLFFEWILTVFYFCFPDDRSANSPTASARMS